MADFLTLRTPFLLLRPAACKWLMLERWRRVSQTFPRGFLKVCVISLYPDEEFRDSPLFPNVQVLRHLSRPSSDSPPPHFPFSLHLNLS